jgi:hypothetical protein
LANLRIGVYGTGDSDLDLDPTRDAPLVWDSNAKRVVAATPSDFERMLQSFRPTYGLSSGWVTAEEMRLSGSGEDEADELEAAIAELTERKLGLLVSPTPFGIGVGRTVDVTCPIIGLGYGRSSAVARSWFKALITDLDDNGALQPVLRVDPALTGAYLAGFGIGADVAGPTQAVQCVGLQWGRPGGNPDVDDVSNGELDVHVFGCAEGVWAMGENGTLRIRTDNCGLSLRGERLNGGLLDLVSINALRSLDLNDTVALNILRWLDLTAYGTLASAINGGGNLIIGVYKTAQVGRIETPWLRVGTVSKVNGFKIQSGTVSGPGGAAYPIELDKVRDWDIDVRFDTGTNRRSIKTTSATSNRRPRMPAVAFGYPTAAVEETFPLAQNLFPNRFLEGQRFGTGRAAVNVSDANESVLVRTPPNAMRVTATAGTPQNRYGFSLISTELLNATAARRMTFAVWLYVPEADGFAGPAPTMPVRIGVATTTSSGLAETKSDPTKYLTPGAYNFVWVVADIPAAVTSIILWVYLNDSNSLAAGTEYVVIDEVVFAPGDCAEAIYEGRVESAPNAVGSVEAGKLVLRWSVASQAAYEAGGGPFVVGDTAIYTDAAAGAAMGRQFTSTGWKNLPNLGA